MAQSSRFRRSLALWAIAIVCGFLLVCAVVLVRPALRARYLFRELETLKLGHSTFEDAQRLADKIGAKPTGFVPCSPSYCEWDVTIGNSKVPRWWRGPGETFRVIFAVKNSFVNRKSVGYGIGIETNTLFPSSVGLDEEENWGRIPRRVPVDAGWQTTELYHCYIFHVYMTPAASTEDRRRYTAYNFSCFWKYKGCKDGRELLPIAATFPSE